MESIITGLTAIITTLFGLFLFFLFETIQWLCLKNRLHLNWEKFVFDGDNEFQIIVYFTFAILLFIESFILFGIWIYNILI